MSASFGRSPVEGDLQAIRQELERSNPELYRQWALYLQVLREILPLSVDQVCFHLATQIYPARYSQLEAPERQHFHTRLGELVKQCCSLLTVEQLISLAIRLGQDQSSQQQPRRSRGPNGPAPSTLPSDGAVLETTLPSPPAGSSDREQPLSPRGSVALGLDLPIEPGWLGWGAASVSADQERGASPPEEPHDPSDPVDDDDDPGDPEHHLDRLRDGLPQALGDLLSDVLAEGADDDEASDGPTDPGERRGLESSIPEAAADGGPGEELGRDPVDLSELLAAFAQATGMGELLSGLQQAADASAGPLPPAPGEPTGSPADMAPADPGEDGGMPGESAGHGVPVGPRGRYALRSLPMAMARNGAGRIARRAVPDPTDVFQPAPASGLLPRDPWLLMLWLQGIERALARRLLHLSHAINRECLQAGLTRVLLPSDLLEAVLAGQIEGQSPQPNLLQLVLPLGFSAAGAALSSYAILLRCADLELDHPRLRTVRGRLQQRRRHTLRMAQRYQRLRRRLQTHEAQALWQEDIEATRRDRQGPTPKR